MATSDKKYKLDLFGILNKFDKKQRDIWNSLSDEEKKEISPLILMRWLSGTSDQRQIIFLNEIANQLVFQIPDHKELLLKLLSVANSGSSRRYTWLSQKSNASEKRGSKRALEIIQQYYQCSPKESKEYLQILYKEDVIEIAESLGLQKDEIQLLKKEF
jgi:hypothetical protein